MLKNLPLKTLSPAQLPELDRAFNAIFKEYLPWPIQLSRHFAPSYVPENRAFTCVAMDKGKVVAHAAGKAYGVNLGQASFTWSSYGNVLTLPEYRGRGLASRINTRLWSALRRSGVDGVYISGGRGLYTRVGATPCGAYFDFELKPSALRLPTGGLSVRRCGPKDLDFVLRLQHADAVGFRRSERDFRTLLREGIAYLSKSDVWLISRGGQALAWAAVGPSWNERAKARPRRGKVTDYAGSRAALMAGLRLISKKLGYRSLELTAGAWDQELIWLAGGKGSFKGVDGTMLLLDPVRLMRRLAPYFESRLGAEAKNLVFKKMGRGYEINLGRRRLRLAGIEALTRLIFGTKAQATGPFKAVFPIPFPIIGLNWT